jgi:hypothetical protein
MCDEGFSPWIPTHVIALAEQRGHAGKIIPVMFEPGHQNMDGGHLFTREEWEAYSTRPTWALVDSELWYNGEPLDRPHEISPCTDPAVWEPEVAK